MARGTRWAPQALASSPGGESSTQSLPIHPPLMVRPRAGGGALPAPRPRRASRSLDLDDGALILKLLLELGRLFLIDAFLDGLATGLDQVFRLFQPETSDGAHLLDDVDLLLAARLQD